MLFNAWDFSVLERSTNFMISGKGSTVLVGVVFGDCVEILARLSRRLRGSF